MIFSIAALLMLGNVCLNAQGNGEGATPTDYSKQPFTIVAHNEDVTIRMIASSSESFEDVQFSIDKGQTWSGPGNTDLFYKVIPANTTLSLRGYFLRYLSSLEISGGTFDVEGNIASLRADYEERNKWHTYTGAINLKGLFSGHTNLVSAENLILPATTLLESCYDSMFKGCTSLIKAPTLPATTLAKRCYQAMFEGCTSLTTAPELPATGVTWGCYGGMFRDCTSLTKAPEILPATNLMDGCNCYNGMFEGCTSLTTAPVLPANAVSCSEYVGMFEGCTKLNYVKCLLTSIDMPGDIYNWLKDVSPTGTFVKAASMNDWASGTSGIPSGWTVINEGATSTDYSKQPFTIVPLERDLTVQLMGYDDCGAYESVYIYTSYDLGQTWRETMADMASFNVSVGQKISFKVEEHSGPGTSGLYIRNKNYQEEPEAQVGKFYVEGRLGTIKDTGNCKSRKKGEGYFSGMTSLVSAENLIIPDDYSCESMFSGCTSLTIGPVLSASAVTENRYKNMFAGCTSLKGIKCLATDISASACTENWVSGVSSTGTFVKASSMNSWPTGASGIPSGWTVINATSSSGCEECPIEPIYRWTNSGTTCVGYDKYQRAIKQVSYDKGNTWTNVYPTEYKATTLIESYCSECGYTPPTPTGYALQYFTFEAIDSGTFSFSGSSSGSVDNSSILYSLDSGSTWNTLNRGVQSPTVQAGQKIMWKSTTLQPLSWSYGQTKGIGNFSSTGRFNVEGNVMSLLYGDNFSDKLSLSGKNGAFRNLFTHCDGLISAENLVLPATTLAPYCYTYMFDACKSLITAPSILPATNLGTAYNCYERMFNDCYLLISAPQLPATKLSYSCYYQMFQSCTSLTRAPELPATTLTDVCYVWMFGNCTSLNYIKCLATDLSATRCTQSWLSGVSSSGTFVKASSMNDWPSGASGIPSGWTITNAQASTIKRTIHVATAGTLPNLISEDEKYQIEELTLTGELNGTDFKFIREMAGDMASVKPKDIYRRVFHDSTDGKLKSLNISNAKIVKGGDYYNYIDSYYNVDGLSSKDNIISVGLFTDTNLETIILPNTVTAIEDIMKYFFFVYDGGRADIEHVEDEFIGVFPTCLSSITISSSVISIGESVFHDCNALNSIIVENGNTNYDSRNNCNALIEKSTNSLIVGCKNTIIPNSVVSIGSSAFAWCSGLKSITIPNSVTSIGSSAFYNCSGLTSITIPNSVTSIGDGAFNGTAWYNNQPDGLLYAGKVAYSYKGEMPANTRISLLEGTLEIAGSAFFGCSGLTSVTIPNSVTSIGSSAFSGCSGLTSITIPNSVTSIGSYAFSGSSGLKSITIPNSVTSIGEWAFSHCGSLTSITIPNSVTSIGDGAFYNCSGLTKVVSKIKKPFTIDASVFPSDIYSNAELVVPAGTKSLYEAANGWKSFSKIIESPAEKRTIHVATAGTLPDLISEDEKYQIEELTLTGELNGTDIHFIRDMAGVNMDKMGTEYCPGINDEWAKTKGKLRVLDLSCVTIVEGGRDYYKMMTSSSKDLFDYYQYTKENSISTCMFADCWKLEQLILPRSVTSISDPLCDIYAAIPITINIKILKVADGNSYYDSRNNCNAIIETKTNTMIAGCLTTKIPESVTSIGDNAFLNLKNLSSVTIPNSVTSIGQSAFSGCSGLTSVTIPNSVTSIGEYAFSSCKGLTSITIPNNVTGIGDYAFIYCSGLTSITIPNSVTSIGDGAFFGCNGLKSVIIGNNITSVGNAFQICDNLQEMTLSQTAYDNGIPESVKKYTTYSKNPMRVEVVSKGVVSATMKIYPIDEQGNTNENNFYTVTTSGQTPGQYIRWKLDEDNYGIISEKTEGTLTLETLPAQPMSTTKARLIALANEEDDDQHYGFEWLRYDAPQEMPANKVSAPLYEGRIIGSLGGLNPDIYYKYRPFYKSDSGEMAYGEWIPFLTGDANVFFEPEVHTKEAIVSNDGALLSAVFVEGTEDIQEKGFEYWQKNSNARAVSLTRGNNIGSVIVSGNNTSVTIEGLKAGTEYGYRSYVKTASGITYGEEKTFKTSMFGDVNGDNKVDNNDLNDIVSYIMGNIPAHFNKDAADLNNDNKVNAADIVKMVNILK